MPGAGFGFISGAVGGYISSGGRLDATLIGGAAGALVGLVNPVPGITGVVGGNVGASIVGQMVGNVSTCKPTYDVDLFAAGMAGLGGGIGRGFGQYLSSPTRSASAYIIYRGLGATRPAVQEPVSRIKRCWRKADSRSNSPQAESVRLNMPLTFPDMGFGLGCMVEGCALFGMADCRSAPNPPYAN